MMGRINRELTVMNRLKTPDLGLSHLSTGLYEHPDRLKTIGQEVEVVNALQASESVVMPQVIPTECGELREPDRGVSDERLFEIR